MSVPASFFIDKDEILALLRQKGCTETNYVKSKLNSYGDAVSLLFEFSKTFDFDTAYLTSILGTVSDIILMSYGIYVNKTLASVTNPAYIVNSTIGDVYINSTPQPNYRGLEIVAGSNITRVTVQGNTRVGRLVIASGSTVSQLEIQSGSIIETLYLKDGLTSHATLDKMVNGSTVEDFSLDEESQYGGTICLNTLP